MPFFVLIVATHFVRYNDFAVPFATCVARIVPARQNAMHFDTCGTVRYLDVQNTSCAHIGRRDARAHRARASSATENEILLYIYGRADLCVQFIYDTVSCS